MKHYRTKTIEEFLKKCKRGRAFAGKIDKKGMLDLFFSINKKTKEKIDIINKTLNFDYH